jgi:hypothetical protein
MIQVWGWLSGTVAGRVLLVVLASSLLGLLVLILWRNGGEDAERERVLAPIDAASIRVLESHPPQYVLDVTAGLPNGCARASGYDVDRLGDTVRVRVYNTMPTGKVACTLIYGTYQLNIPLGSDFQSGREYRVDVNGQLLTLRAQ